MRAPGGDGLQACVSRHARAAGFAAAGIAPVPRLGDAEANDHAAYFEAWVRRGHAGEMEYLKRRDALGRFTRSSLEAAVPWARSVIVCAAPYGSGAELPLSTDPAPAGTGWIARYAWSGRQRDESETLAPSDYHKVLLRRLKSVEAGLRAELGPFQSWASVDTGPLVERAFAAMAGIGWTGKNACTLHEQLGSFFFLGVILTDIELAEEQRAEVTANRCGSCTRCLEACPTDALIAPGQMDASRCIAYLTIEKRGSIDAELREGMGRQVFGCDICQDVCPWNTRARRRTATAPDPELRPRPELVNPDLAALAALDEEGWGRMFFGSPVKRARFSGFRRNLAIAIGNSGESHLLPLLSEWAADAQSDQSVCDAASWAIERIRARERQEPATSAVSQTEVTRHNGQFAD